MGPRKKSNTETQRRKEKFKEGKGHGAKCRPNVTLDYKSGVTEMVFFYIYFSVSLCSIKICGNLCFNYPNHNIPFAER